MLGIIQYAGATMNSQISLGTLVFLVYLWNYNKQNPIGTCTLFTNIIARYIIVGQRKYSSQLQLYKFQMTSFFNEISSKIKICIFKGVCAYNHQEFRLSSEGGYIRYK